MALDYDAINGITMDAMMPALLIDNLFTSGGCMWGLGGLTVRQDPGRGWRELFEAIDKMDKQKEEV